MSGKVLIYALIINFVSAAANSLVSFLTSWAPDWRWAIGPVVATVFGALTKQIESHRDAPSGSRVPDSAAPPEKLHDSAAPSSLILWSLVVLIGGLVLTAGISYVVGWTSGNETGVERLARETSINKQGLSLTALSVQETRHFTRVQVLVENGTPDTVTLPLFGNCYLTASDGTSLEADSFRSDWGNSIVAGGVRKGTINFAGHLPAGTTAISLSFATVYPSGFSAPTSITLKGIELSSPQDASGIKNSFASHDTPASAGITLGP